MMAFLEGGCCQEWVALWWQWGREGKWVTQRVNRWPRWGWVCPRASKKRGCGGKGRDRRGEKGVRNQGRVLLFKTLGHLWTLGKEGCKGRDLRAFREGGRQPQ